MFPQNPETPAERYVASPPSKGALDAKAVVEILKPFEEQTAAGPMPFAIVGGQVVPLASAVTRLATGLPTLPHSSTPTASSTTRSCPTRSTSPSAPTRPHWSAWDRLGSDGSAACPRATPVSGIGAGEGTFTRAYKRSSARSLLFCL